MHLNFLTPAPEKCGPLKTKNHCITISIIYTTRLPHKQFVGPKPKFQAPAPPPKSFWLQPSKVGWAPVPQTWLKYKVGTILFLAWINSIVTMDTFVASYCEAIELDKSSITMVIVSYLQ